MTLIQGHHHGKIQNQNPALEWNLQNREEYLECQRPILNNSDVKAIFAPAIKYKGEPITANSLEVALTSNIGIFVAIPQLRLVYKSINTTLNQLSNFLEKQDQFHNQKYRSDRTPNRRKRKVYSIIVLVVRHHKLFCFLLKIVFI